MIDEIREVIHEALKAKGYIVDTFGAMLLADNEEGEIVIIQLQ